MFDYGLVTYEVILVDTQSWQYTIRYCIEQWYPTGTQEYKTRDSSDFKNSGRLEFSGEIAKDIRNEYVDFFVGKAVQNPVRYKNI